MKYNNASELFETNKKFFNDDIKKAWFIMGQIYRDTINASKSYYKDKSEGNIAFEEKGSNGFGYDNLFIVNKYNKTFAEMPSSIKNAISHRANALEKMKKEFSKRVVR